MYLTNEPVGGGFATADVDTAVLGGSATGIDVGDGLVVGDDDDTAVLAWLCSIRFKASLSFRSFLAKASRCIWAVGRIKVAATFSISSASKSLSVDGDGVSTHSSISTMVNVCVGCLMR